MAASYSPYSVKRLTPPVPACFGVMTALLLVGRFEGGRTCIIACSREAKAHGVQNIMLVEEARKLCRDLG